MESRQNLAEITSGANENTGSEAVCGPGIHRYGNSAFVIEIDRAAVQITQAGGQEPEEAENGVC